MKELFYNSVLFAMDAEFCEIMRELEKNSHVLLLSEPEKAIVHLRYGRNWYDRSSDKDSHIGYATHYVSFLYDGRIFYIQSSDCYPFVDENYLGRFNFICYERVGKAQMEQYSYYEKYENLESVREWLQQCHKGISGANRRLIDLYVNEPQALFIDSCVRRIGGAREKAVLNASPVFLHAETWNKEHRIVHVISSECDHDGHSDSFEFDLVTKQICG